MTRKQAKDALKAIGIAITFDQESEEYRVNYAKPDREASAYYTSDLDDAVGTAELVARNNAKGA